MKEEITEDNFVVEDPLRTQNQKKTGGKNSIVQVWWMW